MDEDELRLAVLGLAVEASSLSGGCTHEVLPEADKYAAWVVRRTPVRMKVTAGDVTEQQERKPMQIHDNEQFTLSVTESDAKGFPVIDAVEWTVDNADVVSLQVSDDKQSCLVVAGNPGSAVVTITDGTLSATEAVDVVAGTAALISIQEGAVETQPPAPGA
jgi:hypothetical protein